MASKTPRAFMPAIVRSRASELLKTLLLRKGFEPWSQCIDVPIQRRC